MGLPLQQVVSWRSLARKTCGTDMQGAGATVRALRVRGAGRRARGRKCRRATALQIGGQSAARHPARGILKAL
ncbi:hypothetical protein MesoLj113a_72800 [Mesorhizobium sp. 113-1-2]|nr:hypothetical protein MesoLj113a_72800 [Mesorhizobium sp. 113-1-2]